MRQLLWIEILVFILAIPIIIRESYIPKHTAIVVLIPEPDCSKILDIENGVFPYHGLDRLNFDQVAGCGIDYDHFGEREQ